MRQVCRCRDLRKEVLVFIFLIPPLQLLTLQVFNSDEREEMRTGTVLHSTEKWETGSRKYIECDTVKDSLSRKFTVKKKKSREEEGEG